MDFLLSKRNEEERARNLRHVIANLQRLPLEKAFTVTVEEKRPKRSEQQNRYLWGVCYVALKRALPGWDSEDIHEYMLGEHFGWERLDGIGRPRLRPIKRSSALSKHEFADFVAFVQRKAAEHGVHIADPSFDEAEENAA